MLARLLVASLLGSMLGLVAPAVATTPNTPSDGSASVETMCLLDGLSFTPGFTMKSTTASQPFDPTYFSYQLDCTTRKVGDTFQVFPHTFDSGSSVEVMWNGVRVNWREGLSNAISNYGTSPNSPRLNSSMLAFGSGTNTLVLGVGCNGLGQPVPCYYQYTFTCSCSNGGGVVGDPQFVGLRGQNYQVHGVAGEIYNIVSDADLQYNSKFAFLDAGDCPVVNGVKQDNCWSHPGSYLGELGLKTAGGDKIRVVTGPAKLGYEAVLVNGKELKVGKTILLKGEQGSISRNSTHDLHVQVGNWDFEFQNSDMFVNQKVRVLDARKLASHGLLGQTWRAATYPNPIKYVQGSVDDYVIRDKDLFGDNFLYNQFS